MIYFKTRVLKYITFTFVPATFELYQLGVPIRVKKRYILVLHGEVYRFRGPYKDDLTSLNPSASILACGGEEKVGLCLGL